MKTTILVLLAAVLALPLAAQETVIFAEAGFPSADSAAATLPQLPGSQLAGLDKLKTLLTAPSTELLILPYGSAFPEDAWSDINQFLQRGGNLLVLGGRPFTRAAYRDASGWHLRDYSVRFTRPLMIDQYQPTPGSDGLEFQNNPEIPLQLPRFAWKRGYSPVIRLSAVDLYKRGGAAGAIDARLDTLAWGVKDGRKLAAPAIEIDHLRNGFNGGRWIFVNAELTAESLGNGDLVRALAAHALQGAEEFLARPTLPLYLPGEPVQLDVTWQSGQTSQGPLTLNIAVYPEGQPSARSESTATGPFSQPIVVPAPTTKGLHVVEAKLMEGDKVRAIYHSGFWVRDEAYLRSGPRLTVNADYFELDGKPLPVVGTTYMSSEVQRLYFEHPNVYVWDQDMKQISGAGLNMIRSGWWTGWDKFCDENGIPYDRTMRTMEAYLMTARKNGLPIQFNFFAFIPDVLGGANSYLDPGAVSRQKTLISSVVTRFHDVPWLAWDLVNEPSISQRLWTMRPQGDWFESQKWNGWLDKRYPDRAALAAAWNVPASKVEGSVSLPEDIEFSPRGEYVGRNSLKVYDYYLFAQQEYMDWVKTMRDAVRATGSQQLVTVGQDEGGIQDRLSPAFWGQNVDFTTNHSWWQNDHILWDSLLAKQAGQAMLIQESGLQRELNMDEVARRTTENEGALFERKVAAGFILGAGAIEWLWNTNSYMTESNETPIGAVRTDYTEKDEATVLRNFGTFAKSFADHLRAPQLPSIAIVTSQAVQFSALQDFQLEAQRKAVRALAYYDRLTAYAVAENQIAKLGSPKLAILPSPQALTDQTWGALLKYVDGGGNLLVTGPVERNEHWQIVSRAADLKLAAQVTPLTYHSAALKVGDHAITLSFHQEAQNMLDSMVFADGSTLKEVPYGKGRIFWAAYPVELSEGLDAPAALYAYVAGRVGITPMFDTQAPLSPGVLVWPTVLQDSVMYVLLSDNAEDAKVELRDKLTGARIAFTLTGQRAAIAVVSKQQKAVVAKYGY